MADQAESSRRAPPMTPPPPPPPSPSIPEDSSGEAILWAASDECSSSTSHTDLLSLWLSNHTAPPQSEAEEEPLADVPTLLNFDLNSSFLDLVDWNTISTTVTQTPVVTQPLWVHAPAAEVPTLLNFDLNSSFPDLVDWKTTSTAVTQTPVVTQPLWLQLYAQNEGEVDDLSRLAHGIQSPKASILPVTWGIQFPEASVSPLALGIHPSPVSFEIQSPKDPMPSLALGIQPPPTSSGIETPQASLSTLALGLRPLPAFFGTHSDPHSSSGMQPPQAPISSLAPEIQSSTLPLARGIQFPQASISSPIPPLALGIESNHQISFKIRPAPSSFSSLPQIPCSVSVPPLPLWNLPSIPCTLPMAPPLRNFPPSPSPVPERRSWSVFPSTLPPARQQFFLLPHNSASASVSSSSSHPSHQPRHFVSAPNTGYQQQGPVAHAPVTFSTPNANANFFAAVYVPTSRPSWSQAMAPLRSWASNEPWINNDQDMKLPIPRRPRFLPPPATATMPAPPPLLANFGNFVGNTPNWNARGDVPVGDQQRVQTGEARRPSRKRSKLAVQT